MLFSIIVHIIFHIIDFENTFIYFGYKLIIRKVNFNPQCLFSQVCPSGGLEVVFFEEKSAENLLSMRFSKRAITSSPVYRSKKGHPVGCPFFVRGPRGRG